MLKILLSRLKSSGLRTKKRQINHRLRLLRIITQAESVSRAVKIVASIAGQPVITAEEMRNLYTHTDRMDLFIQLIATLSQKGYEVPLSSVHWILAVNRQIALGEKIGRPVMGEIKRLLILRKVGLGLNTFNAINIVGRRLKEIIGGERASTFVAPVVTESIAAPLYRCELVFR